MEANRMTYSIATIAKHQLIIVVAFHAVADSTSVVLVFFRVIVIFRHQFKIFFFFRIPDPGVFLYQSLSNIMFADLSNSN